MTEEGYKGGLVSRVRNIHSGKKYLISTAQEIDKDYWCTVIHPMYLGFLPNIFKKILVFTRNQMDEARATHWQVKDMIINISEKKWWDEMPNPMPSDGWSPDAQRIIGERLGKL